MNTRPPDPEAGPPALTHEEYEAFLRSDWPRFLEGCEGEPRMQAYLERHPSMVPGFAGVGYLSHFAPGDRLGDGQFHHSPWRQVLFSQPALPGAFRRVPDFMWIACNSAELCAVMVEIERPDSQVFHANGDYSAPYTHALGQIAEWR